MAENTKAILQKAFDCLRQRHGSHGAVAKALGMHRDHYCAMRNGRASIPRRTADYIILKAQEASAQESDPPPPVASAAPEVRP
jgi:hypothetical protein